MKKLFFLFATAIAMALTTSCNGYEDDIYESVQTPPNSELTRLYSSIDSLHNEYSTTSPTRRFVLDKWNRRFLCGIVDACAGAISVETGPGSLICSIVASGLYEDYLNFVIGPQAYCVPRSVQPIRRALVFPVENASFVDSIGYYHNIILDEIQSKKLSFIDDNGEIDYTAYYKEVIAASTKYGISVNGTIDTPLIFKYIDSIIKPLAQIKEGNRETFLSIIFNETYNGFKYDDSKTLQLRDICDKIIYNDMCVNEDKLIEYGTKVNELIVSSNVADDIKDNLKIANNIAINSSLYWSSK